MNYTSKDKNYWEILPILLVFFIALLYLNKSISFDLLGFKSGHSAKYNLFTAITVLFPLSLIVLFKSFREQTFYKKFLLLSLAFFLIAVNFRLQLAFQASAVFVAAVSINLFFERKAYRPNFLFILLFIYFGINTISLLWTSNLEKGFYYWQNLTPIAFIPILFCFFKLDKKDFELIALFFFRFSMIFAFISVSSWIIESRFINFPLENSLSIKKYAIEIYNSYDVVYAWSSCTHPTYNALNILLSLSIGWYYISRKNIKNNITLLELVFLISISLLLTIITSSRFFLIGWIFVNATGFLFVLKNRKIQLACMSCMLIFMALFMWFYSGETTAFVQDTVRVCHYNAAMQGIKENTWLGTGLGGMTKYINKDNPAYAPLHISKTDFFPHQHPHNQIIGDWLQTGIPGLVTILLIIITLFYYGIKRRNWLLLINAIIYFLLMNIEMPLIYFNGIFSFALIFSLLVEKNDLENVKHELK